MVGDLIKFSAFGLLWLSQKETITRPIDWIWSIWLRRYWAPHKRVIGPHRNALFSAFKKSIICHFSFSISAIEHSIEEIPLLPIKWRLAQIEMLARLPRLKSIQRMRRDVGWGLWWEKNNNTILTKNIAFEIKLSTRCNRGPLHWYVPQSQIYCFLLSSTNVERKECNELFWSYQAHDSLRKVVEV